MSENKDIDFSGYYALEVAKKEKLPGHRGYRLLGSISSGGQARVYSAEDLTLQERYESTSLAALGKEAVKVFWPHSEKSPKDREAILERRELAAGSGGDLWHPGLARVKSYGTAELRRKPLLPGAKTNKRFITVTEYMDGGSLKDFLAKEDCKLPQKVLFLSQVAEAMEYVHDLGYAYLDLKPSNVLVRKPRSKGASPEAVLADFDIMRYLGTKHYGEGTPQAMAPEHFDGGRVTPELDIYSMGVLATELLTGNLPIQSVGGRFKLAHKQATPRSFKELLGKSGQNMTDAHARLEEVVRRCLEKDPHDRFRSMGEFRRALHAAYDLSPYLPGPQPQTPIETGETAKPPTAYTTTLKDIEESYPEPEHRPGRIAPRPNKQVPDRLVAPRPAPQRKPEVAPPQPKKERRPKRISGEMSAVAAVALAASIAAGGLFVADWESNHRSARETAVADVPLLGRLPGMDDNEGFIELNNGSMIYFPDYYRAVRVPNTVDTFKIYESGDEPKVDLSDCDTGDLTGKTWKRAVRKLKHAGVTPPITRDPSKVLAFERKLGIIE